MTKITKYFDKNGKECNQENAHEIIIQTLDNKGTLKDEVRYTRK